MRCSFSLQRRSRSAASLRSSSMRSLSHLLRSSSARRRSSSFRCSSSRCTAGTQRDGTPHLPPPGTHRPSPPPAPRRSPVWCGGSPTPGWSYGSWCPTGAAGLRAHRGTRTDPPPAAASPPRSPPTPRRLPGGASCCSGLRRGPAVPARGSVPPASPPRHDGRSARRWPPGSGMGPASAPQRPEPPLHPPPPSCRDPLPNRPRGIWAPFPAELSRSRCGAGSRRGISPQGVQGWGHGRGAAPAPQGRAERPGQEGPGQDGAGAGSPTTATARPRLELGAGTGSWERQRLSQQLQECTARSSKQRSGLRGRKGGWGP